MKGTATLKSGRRNPPCWLINRLFLLTPTFLSATNLISVLFLFSFWCCCCVSGILPWRTLRANSHKHKMNSSVAACKITRLCLGVAFNNSFKREWFLKSLPHIFFSPLISYVFFFFWRYTTGCCESNAVLRRYCSGVFAL